MQTLTIWGGNKGFKDALENESASRLSTTIRLAFGEGDIIDTDNDEYDPRIVKLKWQDTKERETRFHKHKVYQNIITHLDQLIFKRFETLHPLGNPIYKESRGKVEEGQAEDIKLRIHYLTGEFDAIRHSYASTEDIMELLVRKLGLMGQCAARIAYLESGGQNPHLEEALSQFYLNAGVLLQYWGNDVRKLWTDVESLETNPIVTYTICKYKDIHYLNRNIILRLLRENPGILNEMTDPYVQIMEKNLQTIKRYNFDKRSHQGLTLKVRQMAKKERIVLFKEVG